MGISINEIWSSPGKDKNYEFYRTSARCSNLRDWVNKVYNKLYSYLDANFVSAFRDDFYSRLWELEFIEFLYINWSKRLSRCQKSGPDFCIDSNNSRKIWIEAVLPKPNQFISHCSATNNEFDFPSKQVALRYTSVLHTKANKIKKYIKDNIIGQDDYVIIATSGIQLGGMYSDMREFMKAILPIEDQLVYFSQGDKPLDDSVARPTHTINQLYTKNSGSTVTKEFIYPGESFSFIDGVVFSEASNLQQLLGCYSSSFCDSTNIPHVFQNYSGKKLPRLFTKPFYSHEFSKNKLMVELKEKPPE